MGNPLMRKLMLASSSVRSTWAIFLDGLLTTWAIFLDSLLTTWATSLEPLDDVGDLLDAFDDSRVWGFDSLHPSIFSGLSIQSLAKCRKDMVHNKTIDDKNAAKIKDAKLL